MINTLYEQFRHWSDGGGVWLMGDPHFNDKDCRLMSPDWPYAMKQINILNSYISKNDTFICLGDVGDVSYIEKIKCRYKVLILGNHDKRGECRKVFDEVYSGPLMVAPQIMLSHEPVPLPFALNIHGHDHLESIEFLPECKHLNLAANICGYKPCNLDRDIIKAGMLSDIPTIHRLAIDEAKRADI